MHEPSRMTISVSTQSHGRKSTIQRLVTLERCIEWIEKQGLDEYTTRGLIELAGRYPTAALPSFRKNFNLMLQRVRAKRKLELGDVEHEQQDETKDQNQANSLEEAFKQAFETKETPSKESA